MSKSTFIVARSRYNFVQSLCLKKKMYYYQREKDIFIMILDTYAAVLSEEFKF